MQGADEVGIVEVGTGSDLGPGERDPGTVEDGGDLLPERVDEHGLSTDAATDRECLHVQDHLEIEHEGAEPLAEPVQRGERRGVAALDELEHEPTVHAAGRYAGELGIVADQSTDAVGDREGSAVPVSYTHLDVYKRQLLVHAEVAPSFLPRAIAALTAAGVTVHGTPAVQTYSPDVVAARPDEFDDEYLSLDIACDIVPTLADAIAHIRVHTTGHSETIVTNDRRAAETFVTEVDAAAVLVNASSRFIDGGEFGFGAEIGISTQKLHARGPMALTEMTSTKYIVQGDGQIRA